MSQTAPPALFSRFARVKCWAFDLDNTLYPAGDDLWEEIDRRMTLFIADRLAMDGISARALQKFYYRKYGTTLRGLMREQGVDPYAFLDFVHDVDHGRLTPNPDLARAIAALPGRKLIFTNGARKHAEKTVESLGLTGLFDGIFDIVAADFAPKPGAQPYESFFSLFSINPGEAAMFEDSADNLLVPHARGMATVLVRPVEGRAPHVPGDAPHIDFITPDLTAFLKSCALSDLDIPRP